MPSDAGSPGFSQRDMADAVPHMVWTTDPAGGATYFNQRWAEYTGLDLGGTLRVGAATLIHPDDAKAVLERYASSIAAVAPIEMTYRLRRRDGAYRWHAAHVVPLRDSSGGVTAWLGTATDVDDTKRVADEHEFLARASRVLGTSLDVHETLRDVARLAVPHLADWCSIELLVDGQIERAAVAHIDPKKVALADELWSVTRPTLEAPNGSGAVMRTGTPEHYPDISDEVLEKAIPDPGVLRLVRGLGLRSSVCVALSARGRTLGALSLVTAESRRPYLARDVAFAEEFALRIAIAVDNARLFSDATRAQHAAEAMAREVIEQSRAMESALLSLRAERDAALARSKP